MEPNSSFDPQVRQICAQAKDRRTHDADVCTLLRSPPVKTAGHGADESSSARHPHHGPGGLITIT
jgi:hypothetical protein